MCDSYRDGKFDPRGDEPDIPYLQIIYPGIVQVPGWDAARRTVTFPPARVITASKFVRGDGRDLEDCLWLMAAHDLDARAILDATQAMPKSARDAVRCQIPPKD